jgi:hypothetical protein
VSVESILERVHAWVQVNLCEQFDPFLEAVCAFLAERFGMPMEAVIELVEPVADKHLSEPVTAWEPATRVRGTSCTTLILAAAH